MLSEYLRGPSSCPIPPFSVSCHGPWGCRAMEGGLCPASALLHSQPHRMLVLSLGPQRQELGKLAMWGVLSPLKRDMPGTVTRSVSILSINPLTRGSAQPLSHLEDGHTENWSPADLTYIWGHGGRKARAVPALVLSPWPVSGSCLLQSFAALEDCFGVFPS